ncbi:MAG: hypothetical protein KKD77_22840 [Gammaproteobacteria bacterium]|nr:hypothetical protein [Gammaproteobacteria bacterium]
MKQKTIIKYYRKWTEREIKILRKEYPAGGSGAVVSILGDKYSRTAIMRRASQEGIKYLGKKYVQKIIGEPKKRIYEKACKYPTVRVSAKAYKEMVKFIAENRMIGDYPHNQIEFMDLLVYDLVEIAQNNSKWNQAHYDLIKLKVLLEGHPKSSCIVDDLLDRIRLTVGAVEAVYRKGVPWNRA